MLLAACGGADTQPAPPPSSTVPDAPAVAAPATGSGELEVSSGDSSAASPSDASSAENSSAVLPIPSVEPASSDGTGDAPSGATPEPATDEGAAPADGSSSPDVATPDAEPDVAAPDAEPDVAAPGSDVDVPAAPPAPSGPDEDAPVDAADDEADSPDDAPVLTDDEPSAGEDTAAGEEGPNVDAEAPSDRDPASAEGVVGPGSPEIPADLDSFRISVIGSSTAGGIGASTGDAAWASLLDAALSAQVSTRFALSNLAVGGYTAYDLAPGSGVPGSIDDAIGERPDLIIVALAGSNDLSPDTSTELFISQMVALREAAKAAGIPTFFMSTLPKTFAEPERQTLREWADAMAAELGSCWIPGTTKPYAPCYVDVFDTLADASLGLAAPFDSGDGQHPNDAGHALLFEAVAAIVEPYVCSKTTCR